MRIILIFHWSYSHGKLLLSMGIDRKLELYEKSKCIELMGKLEYPERERKSPFNTSERVDLTETKKAVGRQ